MPVRTTMVKVGVWDVPGIGTRYGYRVCTAGGREWSIFKKPKDKGAVWNLPPWEYVETGFKSKASAVEYVEELATKETVSSWNHSECNAVKDIKNCLKKMQSDKGYKGKTNTAADLLNNIDDGVGLNEDSI